MTNSERKKAIEIISEQNSVNVSFNVPVKNHISNVYEILIHNCNVSTTKALINAGFLLSMTDKGLHVDKY